MLNFITGNVPKKIIGYLDKGLCLNNHELNHYDLLRDDEIGIC